MRDKIPVNERTERSLWTRDWLSGISLSGRRWRNQRTSSRFNHDSCSRACLRSAFQRMSETGWTGDAWDGI